MKMHGLGNDFVVFDARSDDLDLPERVVRAIAHRQKGIWFDQLAVITKGIGDAHLTFYNADGSTSAACGNATRCIARYLMTQTGTKALHLTTDRGDLYALDA